MAPRELTEMLLLLVCTSKVDSRAQKLITFLRK